MIIDIIYNTAPLLTKKNLQSIFMRFQGIKMYVLSLLVTPGTLLEMAPYLSLWLLLNGS
jgi:hypothetical protein